LANLAQRLDVSPSKVRELLVSQRKKLMGATASTSAIDEPKVRRIDLLLDITNDNTVVLDDVVETITKEKRELLREREESVFVLHLLISRYR
jgi:altronate dehydratase